MIRIVHVSSPEEMPLVRTLFEEYAASLDIDLCFQDFERELETLPGGYGPPEGTIIIAFSDGEPAGCVALRRFESKICEMKRLYVKPEHRGKGIGRALAGAVIERARELGYASMKLDTLRSMTEANALYVSLGFTECAPYRHNPCESPVYLELSLL
ncbi:MAG: GNAT family N-acetyltransferase [Candidatus Krumholzibacteria bacterium]|nr:GNAT family N-acetyltransferase [Candidatus Krumholzibacteria bacterium]